MDPDTTSDEIDQKAQALHGYVSQQDCNQIVAIAMVNDLVNKCSEMASWILYGGVVLDEPCHHCEKTVIESWGQLTHLVPAVPDKPDLCFRGADYLSACNDPKCSPIFPKEFQS